jgi:hypothetical protein
MAAALNFLKVRRAKQAAEQKKYSFRQQARPPLRLRRSSV